MYSSATGNKSIIGITPHEVLTWIMSVNCIWEISVGQCYPLVLLMSDKAFTVDNVLSYGK